MSTAFHPEMDGLSENSNKTVVRYLGGFATHDQANWDDYLPLAEYAYNSSVHRLTKLTPFELDLGYEPPLPLDLIADLQRQQANESTKTLQGCELVERLQHTLGVARDELRDAQDKQTAEVNKSRHPIDPAITASAKVFLDTKDLTNHIPQRQSYTTRTGTSFHWSIRNSPNTQERRRTRPPKRHDDLRHS